MKSIRSLAVMTLFGLLSLTVFPGCNDDKAPAAAVEKDWKSLIDEKRAFADLEEFAALGGMSHAEGKSEVIRKGRDLIKAKLGAAGITHFDHDGWSQKVPTGGGEGRRTVYMENIVGIIPGKRPQAIAFAAHYDHKILPGATFVGANDGCSGVALTIEMARQLASRHSGEANKPEFTLYFVFFDGEEAFIEWSRSFDDIPDNCYGSRRMAANRARYPIDSLILFDMVGDADLQLQFEQNSHAKMREIFLESSRDYFGIDIFGPFTQILDDHIPFKEAGMLRVIDLIDFRYGPGNSHWHTSEDTVDKCSPRSLAKVGTLTLHAYPKIVTWLSQELK